MLYLGISVVMFYFLAQRVDFKTIWLRLREVNLFWVSLVILVSLAGHLVRSYRWQLLLNASGYKTRLHTLFVGLTLGYFVNLAIPRLGEATRCLVVNRKERASFAASLGTVFLERLIDVFTLLVLFLICLVFYSHYLSAFIEKRLIPIYQTHKSLLFIAVSALGLMLLIGLIFRRRLSGFLRNKLLQDLLKGISSIKHLKQRLTFLLCTVLIWAGYFLTTYLCFFSLSASSFLTASAGFMAMVVGSFARSLPLAGGSAGVFHLVIAEMLLLLSLPLEDGVALAFVIHTTQLLYNVISGLYSLVAFRFIKRMKPHSNAEMTNK